MKRNPTGQWRALRRTGERKGGSEPWARASWLPTTTKGQPQKTFWGEIGATRTGEKDDETSNDDHLAGSERVTRVPAEAKLAARNGARDGGDPKVSWHASECNSEDSVKEDLGVSYSPPPVVFPTVRLTGRAGRGRGG